jgi:hypothetical protein
MALVAYASNTPEAHGSRMLAWSRDRGYNDAAVCLSNDTGEEGWREGGRVGGREGGMGKEKRREGGREREVQEKIGAEMSG